MAELIYGSSAVDESTFISEFESWRFPNERFRHGDHIRLAWIYLRRYGYTTADERMRQSIQGFAEHLGAAHKYHETLTTLWMRLVNIGLQLTPRIDKFEDFVNSHSWLLDKTIVFEYYSRDLLSSDAARRAWTEPDLKPIPGLQSFECRTHEVGQRIGHTDSHDSQNRE